MNSLSELLMGRSEIESEFSKYYSWADPHPVFSSEIRLNQTASFEGFWIFGDGPGVEVTEALAVVDVELLLNIKISATDYCQFELQGNVIDKKYKQDYIGYFNTNGRVRKHIRRRLEVLFYMELIAMHDHLVKEHPHRDHVKLQEIFSGKEIEKVIRSGRKIMRAQG